MAKGKLTKDRQYHGQQFTFGHDIVYHLSLHLWPWYYLFSVTSSFAMILSVFCQFNFGHDIVYLLSLHLSPSISWPKGNWQKTDNIMAKGKLTKKRQYHGQRWSDKRQIISWPKRNWQKTNNMMVVCFCQFTFGHDIVYHLSLHLWPWYYLFSVTSSFAMILYGQREADKRQTISWPMGNWQKKDIIMAKGKLTKDRQYHGQRKTDCLCQFPFVHDIFCLLSDSLWPW
jgi:hypothetical protein